MLQQLLELTGQLTPAAGVAAEALAALRRLLAAWLIQQNPGFAPVPDDPGAAPELLQAAREGEALAGELNAAGVRLRWQREPYLGAQSQVRQQRPRQVFGPFIDDELSLLQFVFFDSGAHFIVVAAHLQMPFQEIREPMLLLPAGSAPQARNAMHWDVPAGTVWMRADRLAAGAQGFVGLRIAGGTFDPAAVLPPPRPDATLLVPIAAPWR